METITANPGNLMEILNKIFDILKNPYKLTIVLTNVDPNDKRARIEDPPKILNHLIGCSLDNSELIIAYHRYYNNVPIPQQRQDLILVGDTVMIDKPTGRVHVTIKDEGLRREYAAIAA